MASAARLTLFDLDHTLLDGDSDVLWCAFLLQQGLLDTSFDERNRDLEARYRAGTVGVREFSEFYVGTLAGRSLAEWEPLRRRFLHEVIVPRLPATARALVQRHRDGDDLVVMTTATNRVITELTAAELGIEHLIATECGTGADGRFDGRVAGEPNMREGKVARLQAWLAARGRRLADFAAVTAYSDSINDLPLLLAATQPVVVNPDARLLAEALARGWQRHDLHDRHG